ncbi:hypothetical protein DCE94_02220 [Agromyces badenianii]|nr:hypothetical protein [Agromyces badenianii]PWC05144.1 hypothetical protein DCE94_02220 [Agromyces badenianii]
MKSASTRNAIAAMLTSDPQWIDLGLLASSVGQFREEVFRDIPIGRQIAQLADPCFISVGRDEEVQICCPLGPARPGQEELVPACLIRVIGLAVDPRDRLPEFCVCRVLGEMGTKETSSVANASRQRE